MFSFSYEQLKKISHKNKFLHVHQDQLVYLTFVIML